MITLEQAPNPYQWGKLPMKFVLSTDEYVTQDTGFGRLYLKFISSPSAGQTLIISYGNEVVTFTFSASTDNTATLLPLTTATTPLLTAFKNNYRLDRDFEITVVSGEIYFLARKKGTEYNAGISGTYSPTWTVYPAQPKITRDFFRILADVFTTDGTNLATLKATPDINNQVTFDVGGILDTQLKSVVPSIADYGIFYQPDMMKRYYLRVVETYGAVSQYFASKIIGQFYACYGMAGHKLNRSPAQFDRYRILSDRPKKKYIYKTYPEWIYLLRTADNVLDTYTIQVSATYLDGSTSNYNAPLDFTAPTDYGVWAISVGLTQLLDLELVNSLYVSSYSINFSIDAGAFMLDLNGGTFIVEHDVSDLSKLFVFRNKYGAYETLHSKAINTKSIKTSSDTFAGRYDVDANWADREQKYNTSSQEKFRSSTGYQPKDWIDYYAQEFIPSEDVWLSVNGALYPVKIDTTSVEYARERAGGLPSFRFDYSFNFTQSTKHNI